MKLASSFKRFLRPSLWILGGSVLLFLSFLLVDYVAPLPPQKSFSTTVMASDSSLLCAYLTPDDKWRMETSLDRISYEMVEAIITKEDRYFYQHPGINPLAIGRAIWSNIRTARRVSGASTITMQLARMAEPAARTYGNKLREMFRALQYEWHYSKDEILEMYLSYLPFGGNVEGVESAAYIFFNRPAAKLSLSQAILLAVIPNRPNSLRLDREIDEAKAFRDKWIEYYRQEGTFSEKELNSALNEGVRSQRFSISPKTPHYCLALKQRYPQQNEFYTTLNLKTQSTVERLLKNHVQRVKPQGVTNGAVMVVDNQTSAVVAYCGSADFYDAESDGQVNGVLGIRSPGSALKPLVYGLGFDKGYITPRMKLLDVPTSYEGFSPENYDGEFRGDVSVHYALANSLNIPVIRLLDEMKLELMLDVLEDAQFKTIQKKRAELGLSVILGGCGVTLEEMTRLYTSFARKGRMYPLAYTQKQLEEKVEGIPLVSEGASFLLAEILSDIARPDLPKQYLQSSRLPTVAWKTGTSYGRRDAWSIGFSPRYTVGVWMGNFDGTGVPDMSGSSMSVPLLLDIFNAIDYSPKKKWFDQPSSVKERKVCVETGLLPSEHCSSFTQDFYMPNASPRQECNLFQKVMVSPDESIQYCPRCVPKDSFKQAYFPIYDAELSLWYELNDVAIVKPPPHNPQCEAAYSGAGPKIVSPIPQYEYWLEENTTQQILLQAASNPSVRTHYWYVNGRLWKEADPSEKVFYLPKTEGPLTINCMGDKGRRSKVTVMVKWY